MNGLYKEGWDQIERLKNALIGRRDILEWLDTLKTEKCLPTCSTWSSFGTIYISLHDLDRFDDAYSTGQKIAAWGYRLGERLVDAAGKSATYTYQPPEGSQDPWLYLTVYLKTNAICMQVKIGERIEPIYEIHCEEGELA